MNQSPKTNKEVAHERRLKITEMLTDMDVETALKVAAGVLMKQLVVTAKTRDMDTALRAADELHALTVDTLHATALSTAILANVEAEAMTETLEGTNVNQSRVGFRRLQLLRLDDEANA